MLDAVDAESEPVQWLNISDISIEFDRQDDEFTLKPGQFWAEHKCQIISNERMKLYNSIFSINQNKKVEKSEDPTKLMSQIYKLLARLALERIFNSLVQEYSNDDRFKITKPLFLTVKDTKLIELHFEIIYGQKQESQTCMRNKISVDLKYDKKT